MPAIQGLIFDLDGTLIDSAPDLRQALNLTLAAHGRRPITLNETARMVGDGMLTLLNRAFSLTGAPITDSDSYAFFQEFIARYRSQKPDPEQIYPGTIEALEFYSQKGVKLGLCTNKQEAATLQLLEDLALLKYFTFVAGGDTFPVHKPHPGHVRGVIEKIGVPTSNCVMIGDGPNDYAAANAAGIPCFIVTHGYGYDLGQIPEEYVLPGFQDLPLRLEQIGFHLG